MSGTKRLVLHVGTPKSGTTYLQAVLLAVRPDLRRIGVLYPGRGYLPRDGFNQQPAMYALAGSSAGWADELVRWKATGYLDRLCAEVAAHRGPVLVSAEVLSFFPPQSATALLSRFGIEPEQVSVLVTARDYGRLLPSVWQQNVKNGATVALRPYLDSVAALRGGPTSPFWTAFGLADLIDRWRSVVGPERVTLVTAPPSPAAPEALWHRFAEAAGIPADLGHQATVPRQDDNVSLTLPQAEMLRQLNLVLTAEGASRPERQQVRARLLKVWMERRAEPGTPRVRLPAHLAADVTRWAAEDLQRLEAAGIRLVGSVADLRPRDPGPEQVSGPLVIDQAVARDLLMVLRDLPPSRRAAALRRPLARRLVARGRGVLRRGESAPARGADPDRRVDLDALAGSRAGTSVDGGSDRAGVRTAGQ